MKNLIANKKQQQTVHLGTKVHSPASDFYVVKALWDSHKHVYYDSWLLCPGRTRDCTSDMGCWSVQYSRMGCTWWNGWVGMGGGVVGGIVFGGCCQG